MSWLKCFEWLFIELSESFSLNEFTIIWNGIQSYNYSFFETLKNNMLGMGMQEFYFFVCGMLHSEIFL